jgi:HK97 family phage prohead protease
MSEPTAFYNGIPMVQITTTGTNTSGQAIRYKSFQPVGFSSTPNSGFQQRIFTLERSAFKEDGSFEGLASAFNTEDSYGTEWQKGAWTAGGLRGDQTFAFLWMHDPYEPVGVFRAEEREDGLWIMGQYDETPAGQIARTRAQSGSAAELSVGFMVKATDPANANKFTETELVEVSQITRNFAAQPGAGLTAVRSDKPKEVTANAEPDHSANSAGVRARIRALLGLFA